MLDVSGGGGGTGSDHLEVYWIDQPIPDVICEHGNEAADKLSVKVYKSNLQKCIGQNSLLLKRSGMSLISSKEYTRYKNRKRIVTPPPCTSRSLATALLRWGGNHGNAIKGNAWNPALLIMRRVVTVTPTPLDSRRLLPSPKYPTWPPEANTVYLTCFTWLYCKCLSTGGRVCVYKCISIYRYVFVYTSIVNAIFLHVWMKSMPWEMWLWNRRFALTLDFCRVF